MTEQEIRAAITEGRGQGDGCLSLCMPRWDMGEDDLDAVVDYLRELG